jgi:hypothetical protein
MLHYLAKRLVMINASIFLSESLHLLLLLTFQVMKLVLNAPQAALLLV